MQDGMKMARTETGWDRRVREVARKKMKEGDGEMGERARERGKRGRG